MAGGCGSGKLLDLIPRIYRHSDEVEADLQRYYGVRYADRFTGDMTIRRLLVLVQGLPQESLFKSAVYEVVPTSVESQLLMEISESLSGKSHPRRTAFKDADRLRREAAERKARQKLIEQRRKVAREHNARVIARREGN